MLGFRRLKFDPPIPLMVLGEAKGRLYSQEELDRKFAQARLPRITNRYGCVTLHRYHFYVEAGLPHTQVSLWIDGAQLRAIVDHVVLAEYHCHYDWREHKVTDIRDGVFYATRFASPQGSLVPVTPPELRGALSPQAHGPSGATALASAAIVALCASEDSVESLSSQYGRRLLYFRTDVTVIMASFVTFASFQAGFNRHYRR